MKLPRLFNDKNKLFAAAILAIILIVSVGGGIYYSNKKDKEASSNQAKSEQDKQIQENLSKKEESLTNQNPSSSPQENQEDDKLLTELTDITLQGSIDESGEISVSLYGAAGNYKIQKMVNGGSPVTIIESAKYSGRGGFAIEEKIPSTESSRTFWIYRILDGKVSQHKAITVERNVIVQKGGIINFPEAQ